MVKKKTDYVSDRVFDGVRPLTGKKLERLKEKRAKELEKRKEEPSKKKSVKETFEIGSFTERGALSLRKIYERAGYKFVSHRVGKNELIMQKFRDKD